MLKNEPTPAKKERLDAFTQAMNVLRFFKIIFIEPVIEIARGFRTHSLPMDVLSLAGILLSICYGLQLDEVLIHKYLHIHTLRPGELRAFLGAIIPFSGFWMWGYFQMGMRARFKRKLDRIFLNSKLKTQLNELPIFVWDHPVDEATRKLRVRSQGMPLSDFINAREILTSQLDANIVKIENPKGDLKLVDIIYTKQTLSEIWSLESAWGYSNFSFPVGKSFRGIVKASFSDCPHFLVAGASGGGKSSFIRMLLTVLLTNNVDDLTVYFIDFKGGMENQVFEGFRQVHLIDRPETALDQIRAVNAELERRTTAFRNARARDFESFNKKKSDGQRVKRVIVVVDEISELIANRSSPNQAQLRDIGAVLNRISRMGRAVGINLVIGVQKPDVRNLDATIKSNLTGIICFPVTHYSQSVVALGNARAAELSTDHPGRAIWQRGSTQFEIQTPHLTEEGVNLARSAVTKDIIEEPISPEAPIFKETSADSEGPQSPII